MNFYKRYVGDYQRDTAHLDLMQHGAYNLMLDQFYGTGKPLPGDRKALYRMLRAETPAEKRAIDEIALQFWRVVPEEIDELEFMLGLHSDDEKRVFRRTTTEWTDGGGLINLRALREIFQATAMAERNKKIAIDREEKRRAQRNTPDEF